MFWPLLIIGLLSFVYLCFIRPFQYWKHRQVPQHSVLKILKDLMACLFSTDSLVEMTRKVYEDFPDERYIGIYQFASPGLHLRDPELLRQLTIKNFDHFTDHFTFMTEEAEPLFTKSLFGLQGERWKSMSKTLTPSFASNKLKTIFPLIIDCAKNVTAHLEKECQVSGIEVDKVFTKFSCDVIATSAFGISINSFENPNNDFICMTQKVVDTFKSADVKMLVKLFLPKLANILNLKIIDGKVQEFFKTIILKNIKLRETEGIVRPDMVQLLIEAKQNAVKNEVNEEDEDNDEILGAIKDKENKIKKTDLTDTDIAAQAFMFFFAGFGPVFVMMSFLAYELAVNPDVQEKLYQEIQEHIRQFGADPTYESLMGLKYLNMVISEALRKSPILSLGERVCTRPYTIQPKKVNEHPIHLKVGQPIFFTPYAMHHDPKYFLNPERFDPERFNEENVNKIIPGTYLPFGIGPRHCIGSRLAIMEMKLAFYYLLSKLKIVVVEKTPIPMVLLKTQLLIAAKDGFWVGFENRA